MILVKYIDTEFSKSKNKVVKVKKYGFWKNGKVKLFDKNKTIVRNWNWVKIVWPLEAFIFLYSIIKVEFKFKIIIKP